MSVNQERYGHYDSVDVISLANRAISQIRSDVEQYNKEEVSQYVAAYSEDVFKETQRTVMQAPKKFTAVGEAGDAAHQSGRSATMTFTSKSYDVSTAYTEEFLEDATFEEIMKDHDSSLIADNRLINTLFFVALMLRPSTSTTSNTVGFYYGQTDVPNHQGITHYGTAHDHYLVSGDASWLTANFSTARNHITHHGYGETNGGVVALMNSVESTVVAALSGFSDSATISEEMLRDGIVGKIKGVFIKEVNWVPNNYIIFLPFENTPVVVHKQHEKEENRGLKIVESENRANPLQGTKYKRIKIGFDVVLKGAGVVMYKHADTWAQQTSLAA